MITLGLFQECKDSSIYANQSVWYTILTNWKIKPYDNLNRWRKSLWQNSAPIYDSVQFSRSVVSDSENPWTTALQASLSITNSWTSPKPMTIESVIPSNHLILCRSLLLLPPIPPSIRIFSNESTLCMRWPKYGSLSFSIIPSKEIPGLISFRMDWLDLLAVQGTLRSLLQHHSSKESILWRSAFFQSNSHIHTWPLEKL